jgi:hypothetical protein
LDPETPLSFLKIPCLFCDNIWVLKGTIFLTISIQYLCRLGLGPVSSPLPCNQPINLTASSLYSLWPWRQKRHVIPRH